MIQRKLEVRYLPFDRTTRVPPGTTLFSAAHWIGLAGCGVPGAELGQPQHRSLDPVGVGLTQQISQFLVRFSPGERRTGAGQGRTAEEGRRDRGDGRGGQERAAGRAITA